MEAPKIDLRQKIGKLRYLALNYDPYSPCHDARIHQYLRYFKLDPQTQDPFSITNHILILLDELEKNQARPHDQLPLQ